MKLYTLYKNLYYKKYLFIIFGFLTHNVSFCQQEDKSELIDSLVITHMPLSSRGSFNLSEMEFRKTQSPLKKRIIITDNSKIKELYSSLEKSKNDTLNLNRINILVIFDFYLNKEKQTVLMDCGGIISISSESDLLFFNKELNHFFRKITNQEKVICDL